MKTKAEMECKLCECKDYLRALPKKYKMPQTRAQFQKTEKRFDQLLGWLEALIWVLGEGELNES